MNGIDLLGIAGLLAGLVAAVYAGLTYHSPRAPRPQKPPHFEGELPADRNKLRDFLTRHEGQLVFLELSVSLLQEDISREDDCVLNGLVSSYDQDAGEFREALHFTPETQEGDVIGTYVYDITSVDPSRGILGRHPAGGWMLRGSFIPRGSRATVAAPLMERSCRWMKCGRPF